MTAFTGRVMSLKLACKTRLLRITKESVATLVVRSPVQPAKPNPFAGFAMILKLAPTLSNCPLAAPETVPFPLRVKVNGLTTTKLNVRATVVETLLLVSMARTRTVFGPGIRLVAVADQLWFPAATLKSLFRAAFPGQFWFS